MACNIIYDFVSGARIQLPAISSAATAVEDDGRHGVRAILNPNEAARTLLNAHVRMLSQMKRAVPDS